jgi:hypothetical protein
MRRAGLLVVSMWACGGALVGVASASAHPGHAAAARLGHQFQAQIRRPAPPPSSSSSVACFNAFGKNAGPRGGDGCVSLISDIYGYCLTSRGGKTGTRVTQARCSRRNRNEVWWVTDSGQHGTFEIWNAGSSCPRSMAWYSCGTPYGKQPQGNGYCLGVSGGGVKPGAKLVMEGCDGATVTSDSWEGAGTAMRAWLLFQGPNPRKHYCAAALSDMGAASFGIKRCSMSGTQNFAGGTFGDKAVSVTPPTTAPDPR